MSSRKTILTKKFIEFQEQIKDIIPTNTLFPTLEQYELIDLLIMFDMNFKDCKCDDDCREVINGLMKFNGLKMDEMDENRLIETSIRFIKWLKEFQEK